jgi:two-component system sensor histidine kinase GlrK
MSIAQTDEVKNLLLKIQEHKIHYQSEFAKEVKFVQLGQDYPREKYDQEKEKSINGITEGLKKLRTISQHVTYSKIRELDEAEASAINVALWMTITSLVFVVIISTFITVHITRPLSLIEKKTREIAKGDFKGDLKLQSPPEIKELAQAVNYMCTKLKEIDKMKSDFFSLMSHELRTPLTSIKEGTNLLIEGLQDGKVINKQERILKIIAEESNRLIKLVNSLMDIARMEAGMMKYHFTKADLMSMIDKVTREMEPLAETKNIKFKTNVSEGLPSLTIDVERILQVLRNLLGNAVKFTPKGGNVLVSAVFDEKGVKVTVKDTGIGIKKEDLTSIFDKFQQAILPNSSKTIGTGLGLSIDWGYLL